MRGFILALFAVLAIAVGTPDVSDAACGRGRLFAGQPVRTVLKAVVARVRHPFGGRFSRGGCGASCGTASSATGACANGVCRVPAGK